MLDTNKFLRKVLIVGAADRLIRAVPDEYRDRVKFYGESSLEHAEAWRKFSAEHVDEPVYISVDKDVLNTASAVTNWDQGSLSLASLESLLSIILRNENVIGIDVCGECTPSLDLFDEQRSISIDGKANHELFVSLLQTCFYPLMALLSVFIFALTLCNAEQLYLKYQC